jgi:N-acetylglucosamine kinase-like BadF-type ATPase
MSHKIIKLLNKIKMRFVLGIDGGASKTVCYLANLEGKILGKGKSGSSNFHNVGMEKARKAILDAVIQARNKAGIGSKKADVCCLGMAGSDRESDRIALESAISSLEIAKEIVIVSDAKIALSASIPEGQGIVVIGSTGSIAYGRNLDGKECRTGGWGHLLGDEGSGFYIGMRALNAALRTYDGREIETRLEEEIKTYFRIENIPDLIGKIYRNEKVRVSEISAFAPRVIDYAGSDLVAKKIIRDAAKELALLAKAVAGRLGIENEQKFKVFLKGGLFKKESVLAKNVAEELRRMLPSAEVKRSSVEPVYGAVSIAVSIALSKLSDCQ